MTTQVYKRIVQSQVDAAFAMLEYCIRNCPAKKWNGTIGKYPFWQVEIHTRRIAAVQPSSSPASHRSTWRVPTSSQREDELGEGWRGFLKLAAHVSLLVHHDPHVPQLERRIVRSAAPTVLSPLKSAAQSLHVPQAPRSTARSAASMHESPARFSVFEIA